MTVQDAFWAQLDPIWAPKRVPRGAQDEPKTDPRRVQNRVQNRSEKMIEKWTSQGSMRRIDGGHARPQVPTGGVGGDQPNQPEDQYLRSSTPLGRRPGEFSYMFLVFASFCYIFLGFFILVTRSSLLNGMDKKNSKPDSGAISLGIFGIFLNRKNVITILMSIELMLLAVNINMVAFSAYNGDLEGQVFSLFILTVAAAEAAIGLAILVVFFRNRGSIAVEDVNVLKG